LIFFDIVPDLGGKSLYEPIIPPTLPCPSILPVFIQPVSDSKPFHAEPAIPPTPLKLVEFVAVILPVLMQEMMCPSLLRVIPPMRSTPVMLPLFVQLIAVSFQSTIKATPALLPLAPGSPVEIAVNDILFVQFDIYSAPLDNPVPP